MLAIASASTSLGDMFATAGAGLASASALGDPGAGPLAYIGLTLAVPVFLTAVVAVTCALLFVLTMSLGIGTDRRWVYSSVVFVVLTALFWGLRVAVGLVRKLKPAPVLARLDEAVAYGFGPADIGRKALNLARLADAGVRVPPGWTVSSKAFEAFSAKHGLTDADGDPARWLATVAGGAIPGGLLKRLHLTLEAAPHEAYVLRSSFADEDAEGKAFPGVFESVVWRRQDGRKGLEKALRTVWSSWGSERSRAYRAQAAAETGQPLPGGVPRLPVLVNALVDHRLDGFIASVDVLTGFAERHLVDVATEGAAWSGTHDVLTGRIVSAGAGDTHRPSDALVRELSAIAGQIEALFGLPVEVEWGVDPNAIVGGEEAVWIYQARPLTALEPVDTWTNSHVVEVPRYPMTELSQSFLFGDRPPAELIGRGFAQLGLDPLAEGDVKLVDGSVFVRFNAFKPFVAGKVAASPGVKESLTWLKTLVGAVLGGPKAEVPVPAPPGGVTVSSMPPADAASALRTLRDEALLPAVDAQIRVTQLSGVLDRTLASLRGSSDPASLPSVSWAPMNRAQLALAGGASLDDASLTKRLWYVSDREAELAAPRLLDNAEAQVEALRLGAQALAQSGGGAPEDAAAGAGLAGKLIARGRERLYQDREALNVRINVANAEARRLALAADAYLDAAVPSWPEGGVFHLSLDELASARPGPELRELVLARAAVHAEVASQGAASTFHVDGEGQVVTEPEPLGADGRGVVAVGVPLGKASVEAALLFVDRDAPPSPADVTDRIVVLPDPAVTFTPVCMAARGVVFERGGPLSHLAIVCREHGVPALVATGALAGRAGDGEVLTLDAERGALRRAL